MDKDIEGERRRRDIPMGQEQRHFAQGGWRHDDADEAECGVQHKTGRS